MHITPAMFAEQKYPQFGTSNPEQMRKPFWELMIRGEHIAWWARTTFDAMYGTAPGAIWCFERFGMSRTTLPDGRVICIAGEHEDHYDPDFYIYNDVIILHPDDTITIYGYPKTVFPPTDFHSATLIGNKILIIGTLGYMQARVPGVTPVYQLDCTTFRIEQITTTGAFPGWLFEHDARVEDGGASVVISGGKLIVIEDDKQVITPNRWDYRLSLHSHTWTRLNTPATEG